jgi:UDP-2-acetamido-3-amino-2,3-dideoxy-glucuronate N-acetyltransferase
MGYFVHPTAVVDSPETSIIGDKTKVWHFTHIMSNVKIGESVNIGQNVFIASNVVIGNGVKIQNNVSLYDGLVVEDDVFLGPSVVFTNVRRPRAFISQAMSYEQTIIKKGATIGANSTIICGVSIGEYAFVGAGAVVTKSIPPYGKVYGTPARLVGFVCVCGEDLQSIYSHHFCPSCKRNYDF